MIILLTFEMFGRARNNGIKFPKYGRTSFSSMVNFHSTDLHSFNNCGARFISSKTRFHKRFRTYALDPQTVQHPFSNSHLKGHVFYQMTSYEQTSYEQTLMAKIMFMSLLMFQLNCISKSLSSHSSLLKKRKLHELISNM